MDNQLAKKQDVTVYKSAISIFVHGSLYRKLTPPSQVILNYG